MEIDLKMTTLFFFWRLQDFVYSKTDFYWFIVKTRELLMLYFSILVQQDYSAVMIASPNSPLNNLKFSLLNCSQNESIQMKNHNIF